MANGDGVTYTTKELLQRLDEKLDRIATRLDEKASTADVVALTTRVYQIELHGSAQAAEALKEVGGLRAEVQALEKSIADRPEQVRQFHEVQADVKSLSRWRYTLAGAIAGVGGLAVSNFAHVWFGIGG